MKKENHKSQSLPSFGKNDEQESCTEPQSMTMRRVGEMVFLFSLLLVCCAFSLTSKCTQTFELLAKTDRVLWIALDVNGECHYSHLIQVIMTDSIVLEVPPTVLAKFKGWRAIKESIRHFQIDVPIRLEKTGSRWQSPVLSWSVKEAPSSPSLLDQYEKFNERSGSFDGRRWNQVKGRAGLQLPKFDGIDMSLIYAFPAGLYLNYKIIGVFFFEGSGNLLIFTQQEILASGYNTMHGFLIFKKY